MTPPVSQSRTLLIEVPPTEIWKRLTDLARWPEWNPLCERIEVVDPLLPGARFVYSNGQMNISAEITALIEPQRFAFRGRALGVTALNSWRLQPISSRTTLVEVREDMNGLLPLIFRKQFDSKLGTGLESWLVGLERSCTGKNAVTHKSSQS